MAVVLVLLGGPPHPRPVQLRTSFVPGSRVSARWCRGSLCGGAATLPPAASSSPCCEPRGVGFSRICSVTDVRDAGQRLGPSSEHAGSTSFLRPVVVQSLSRVPLFATPWTAARQASLSITLSRSLLKLMSIKSVMPSNHLILCCPLLLPPSIFPSIRVFSNESALCIRWPKC